MTPMNVGFTLASTKRNNEDISIRASDDIQEGLLLHPCEIDADIGMRCQQPVRRLLSAVSQGKGEMWTPCLLDSRR